MNGAATKSSSDPPRDGPDDVQPEPARGPNRVIGLLAAVGFSLAMWAFIALAVLGVILKVMG